MDAVSDSVVNFRMQDGQKNDAQEGVRYSLRGVNQNGIEVYETSDEVKALAWKERKARYLDIMRNEYADKTAKFTRNGHDFFAKFDPNSLRKPIYGDNRSSQKGVRALINAGADGDFFTLVENSQYRKSKENTKEHTNADYFDYFVKTVQIDGKVFDLVADVERNYFAKDGYVYTLALRDNKTMKASPAHSIQDAGNGAGNASIGAIPQQTTEVKGNVRYSSRTRQDSQIDRLTAQNEKLQQEADYLRQLVQIQKSGNKDFILDRNSVKKQAGKLMASANAKGDTGEFSRMLNDFYHRMHTDSEITWDAMQEDTGAIADTVDADMPDRLADIVRWANSSKEEKKETHPTILKVGCVSLAERVGFEPTVRCRITSFQDWLLKPLGHLSIGIHDSILHLESQG